MAEPDPLVEDPALTMPALTAKEGVNSLKFESWPSAVRPPIRRREAGPLEDRRFPLF
jgi:hypothetical protein